MDKKFARRISGAALAAAAALALAACSSSGSSSGGSSSGTTTLKLVVADYGTGPSNASAKYWDGIVTAFEKVHPDIKVNVTSIAWTNFDQQVQTMIQNKQYPDITEGDYFSNYAKDGLLYSASDVLSNPGNLLPAFKPNGHEAQIKEFLDFAYQDKYQLAFDKEYDLLPATTTAATALSSDPVFGPFLTALPNSVQYPSDTSWANVKAKIQQTIGLAVTGTPSTELSQLQQVATTSAS